MVVCLCQGVSDKKVRASIEAGARTRQQVTDACGAGDGCGTCHRTIKSLIVECRGSNATASRPAVPVGFGDTVPIHPLARSLTTLEATIGQLYPAIILARLVSLEVGRHTPRS